MLILPCILSCRCWQQPTGLGILMKQFSAACPFLTRYAVPNIVQCVCHLTPAVGDNEQVGMPGASEREGILRVIIRKELEARPGCIDRLLLENKCGSFLP